MAIKDILVIAHFCGGISLVENNRFVYLANLMASAGYKVELVTSSFSHSTKKPKVQTALTNLAYKANLIYEPPYKKNVSIKRIYSHSIFGKNVRRYLYSRKPPDLVYCAVPSLSVALTTAKYCKVNNVKFIIDVQDLWPEAFYMVSKLGFINKILFYNFKKQADFIYNSADCVIAVSDTYKKRALLNSLTLKPSLTVYLGTDLDMFDEHFSRANENMRLNDGIRIVYLGTLGHSYDLYTAFNALELISKQSDTFVEIIILGDGPLEHKFRRIASNKRINVKFMGWLNYPEMVKVLRSCDIALNLISRGAAQSIINKHADYAAAGLPVLNTQESLEYRFLIESYNAGINCKNSDPKDLSEKILYLASNPDVRNEMGKNSRRMADDCFDRKRTYPKIVDLIFGSK